MIITKISDGLGNQMFQYGIGKHLALINGTELKLDLSWYNNQDAHDGTYREYTLHNFDINAETVTPQEITNVINYGKIGYYLSNSSFFDNKRRLTASLFNYYKEYMDLPGGDDEDWPHSRFYDDRMTDTGDGVYLDGYWQTQQYVDPVKDVLRDEFTVLLEGKAAGLLEEVKEKPSIGVHVRGRDFFTQGPGRGNTLTQEYYDLALDYMKNHTKNPSLYVFSDDPEWAKENVRFDEPTEYVSTDYGTNENQDLYLMSKCDHVITANSTFSWWSAWLNENPDKKVTVPSPWKPHGYPRGIVKKWDLTPDSWKIIEWR